MPWRMTREALWRGFCAIGAASLGACMTSEALWRGFCVIGAASLGAVARLLRDWRR